MTIKNLIKENGDFFTIDLNSKEKRYWDPTRSKVCAALKKGLNILPLKEDSSVLYLGCAEGYTCSYISDLVDKGIIFGIDFSPHSMQKFVLLSRARENLYPVIGDANKPGDYKELINSKVDLIIQDVAQKNQIEILTKNAKEFLKPDGCVILSLKTTAISQRDTRAIIDEEMMKFEKEFTIVEKRRLDPFEKKHMIIIGKLRK
ncbi:MAG: fibrillarin-like rRNA/tRNA 2'-O-methyltransferase [archaeon]|jgi:fibrillarin-like pre-rRNA processing protein